MVRSSLLALTMALAECPELAGLENRGLIARNIWEYLKILHFGAASSEALLSSGPWHEDGRHRSQWPRGPTAQRN